MGSVESCEYVDAIARAEANLSDALEAAGYEDRASLDEAVNRRVDAEDGVRYLTMLESRKT